MARVLAISSQVVFGPVGNSAAVPAFVEQSHDVMQLPTILLSHHPGHGRPAVQHIDIAPLIASVEALGGFAGCAAVMTGYFATAEQVTEVAALIARLKNANPDLLVLVDPVLGDDGALYVAAAVAEAIRDRLVPLASIITPNCFELSWLTGHAVSDEATAISAAGQLKVAETLVTSLPVDSSTLGTLLIAEAVRHCITSERKANVPHGTGDFLAGAYLAHRLQEMPDVAFRNAMARLQQAISISGDGMVLFTSLPSGSH